MDYYLDRGKEMAAATGALQEPFLRGAGAATSVFTTNARILPIITMGKGSLASPDNDVDSAASAQ